MTIDDAIAIGYGVPLLLYGLGGLFGLWLNKRKSP